MRKQSRSQRRAIIKANKNGFDHEPLPKVRTNWQAVDRLASPYAAPKTVYHTRIGYLDREAQANG